jgi:hypothetical protein
MSVRREVQLGETLGIDQSIDLGDPSVRDGEGHHREQSPVRGDDGARGAVDDRRPNRRVELGVGGRAPCHGLGAAKDERRLLAQTGIDPELDLGSEHRDECVEVAIARRGEEGVDDLPLSHEIRVGLRGALHAPSRAAGELLSRRFGTVQSRGDVREWHGEDVMQHEGKSLRRR